MSRIGPGPRALLAAGVSVVSGRRGPAMKLLALALLAAAAAIAWLAPRPDVKAQIACLQSAPLSVCSELLP